MTAVSTTQVAGSAGPRDEIAAELAGRKVLIIVENLSVPFDRRVWQEARTLRAAGAQVCIICPKKGDAELSHEVLEGIDIYRHPLPEDGHGAIAYFREYLIALFWETAL